MKKALSAIPIVLCVMLFIVPLMEFFALITGTEFKLYNETAMVIVQTVLIGGAVTALFIIKPRFDKLGTVFTVLLLPIALLNALCFVDPEWPWSALFILAVCGCSLAIYIRFASDSVGKAVSAVFSVLAAIALVMLYIYNLVYGSFFSEITVRKTIPSPDGSYVCEVVTDASVLGDKTRVNVKKSERLLGIIVGEFCEKEQLVYTGEDYEVDTVRISWETNDKLVVNGTEHLIVFE